MERLPTCIIQYIHLFLEIKDIRHFGMTCTRYKRYFDHYILVNKKMITDTYDYSDDKMNRKLFLRNNEYHLQKCIMSGNVDILKKCMPLIDEDNIYDKENNMLYHQPYVNADCYIFLLNYVAERYPEPYPYSINTVITVKKMGADIRLIDFFINRGNKKYFNMLFDMFNVKGIEKYLPQVIESINNTPINIDTDTFHPMDRQSTYGAYSYNICGDHCLKDHINIHTDVDGIVRYINESHITQDKNSIRIYRYLSVEYFNALGIDNELLIKIYIKSSLSYHHLREGILKTVYNSTKLFDISKYKLLVIRFIKKSINGASKPHHFIDIGLFINMLVDCCSMGEFYRQFFIDYINFKNNPMRIGLINTILSFNFRKLN